MALLKSIFCRINSLFNSLKKLALKFDTKISSSASDSPHFEYKKPSNVLNKKQNCAFIFGMASSLVQVEFISEAFPALQLPAKVPNGVQEKRVTRGLNISLKQNPESANLIVLKKPNSRGQSQTQVFCSK